MSNQHTERLVNLRERLVQLHAEIADANEVFLGSEEGAFAFLREFESLRDIFRKRACLDPSDGCSSIFLPDPMLTLKLEFKETNRTYAIYYEDQYTLTLHSEFEDESTGDSGSLVVQLWSGRLPLPIPEDAFAKPLRRRVYVLAVAPANKILSPLAVDSAPYVGWRHRLHDAEGFLSTYELAKEILELAEKPRVPGLMPV
jgi:hypothetical protein